jgi:hypothetical protein
MGEDPGNKRFYIKRRKRKWINKGQDARSLTLKEEASLDGNGRKNRE